MAVVFAQFCGTLLAKTLHCWADTVLQLALLCTDLIFGSCEPRSKGLLLCFKAELFGAVVQAAAHQQAGALFAASAEGTGFG